MACANEQGKFRFSLFLKLSLETIKYQKVTIVFLKSDIHTHCFPKTIVFIHVKLSFRRA